MKRNLCKKLFTGALIAGALLVSQTAQAQLDEIQKFLESGADNATALTQAYLKPLPTAINLLSFRFIDDAKEYFS